MTFHCAAITGASSGIGRAIALKMAQENISLAILARTKDKLEKVASEIKTINPEIKVFQFHGDVRDMDSVENFLKVSKYFMNKGYSIAFFVGPNDLYEKKFGIIGLGSIGKEVVKRLIGFKCKIYVNDIKIDKKFCKLNKLKVTTKKNIFKNCDVISIHTPLIELTENLINRESI